MNYDASLCLVVLLALHSEWRVLRFELVLLSLVTEKLLRAQPMLSSFSAHVPECLFLSCCKTLGSPSLVELCRIALPLFYIPSPSDVGIVFLLRLTTIIALRLKNYCVVEEHSAPEIV